MGLDLTLQTLPPGDGGPADVLALARRDPDAAHRLAYVPYLLVAVGTGAPPHYRDPASDPDADPGELAMADACRRLLAARPDLASRRCDLRREWDALHFALSPTRRADRAGSSTDAAPPDAATRAVDALFDGGSPVAPDATGLQGVPVRLLSPDDVAAAAVAVKALAGPDGSAAAARFDPADMQAAGVYKVFADHYPDPASLDAARRHFAADAVALARFLESAADAGDAVLAVLD